jgi:5-methylcytosine-specific restriction endonuclease McrA
MTLRPCLVCGLPSSGPRCSNHAAAIQRLTPTQLGYDSTWRTLSKRARALQPFCSVCGTGQDLTADHSEEAWLRRARGQVIRLADITVLCRACNTRKGTSRPRAGASRRRPTLVVPNPRAGYTPA